MIIKRIMVFLGLFISLGIHAETITWNGNVVSIVFDELNLKNDYFDLNNASCFGIVLDELLDGSESSSGMGIAFKSATMTVATNEQDYINTDFIAYQTSLLAQVNEAAVDRKIYPVLVSREGFTAQEALDLGLPATMSETYAYETGASLLCFNHRDTTYSTLFEFKGRVQIDIELLSPNVSLGNPELFYDFNPSIKGARLLDIAETEGLKLVNSFNIDAPILFSNSDSTDGVTIDKSQNRYFYYPSKSDFVLVAAEDQFPNDGDYDFNDLVVAIKYRLHYEGSYLKGIAGEAYLLNRGGVYNHDFHIRHDIPGNFSALITNYNHVDGAQVATTTFQPWHSDLDLMLFQDSRQIMASNDACTINEKQFTACDADFLPPKATFQINTDGYYSAPEHFLSGFKYYLVVERDYGGNQEYIEVHMPSVNWSPSFREGRYKETLQSKLALSEDSKDQKEFSKLTSYRNSKNYPFVMVMPSSWQFPKENISMHDAYNLFPDFVTSNGQNSTDWWKFPQGLKVHNNTDNAGIRIWPW